MTGQNIYRNKIYQIKSKITVSEKPTTTNDNSNIIYTNNNNNNIAINQQRTLITTKSRTATIQHKTTGSYSSLY